MEKIIIIITIIILEKQLEDESKMVGEDHRKDTCYTVINTEGI